MLQVVLPLGDTPDRRAGRDPVRDSESYPIGGPCTHGVTGEAVCIRRAPDEAAVRRQAHSHNPWATNVDWLHGYFGQCQAAIRLTWHAGTCSEFWTAASAA